MPVLTRLARGVRPHGDCGEPSLAVHLGSGCPATLNRECRDAAAEELPGPCYFGSDTFCIFVGAKVNVSCAVLPFGHVMVTVSVKVFFPNTNS